MHFLLTIEKLRTMRGGLLASTLAFATIPTQAGVIFQDGFESGNLSAKQNGVVWTGVTATAVSSDRAKAGNYSLKFTFSQAADGADSFAEQRFSLGGNYPDLWFSYDIYIPANYVHRQDSGAANNKGFMYLWSGDYGSPSGPGMGPNFWPVGNKTALASVASHYVWGPGWGKHYWDVMPKAIEEGDRGKWIQIVGHYKYASSANNDGVAEIWKTRDGVQQKVMSITDGAWYVSGQKGFDQGYLLGWANSGFAETTIIHIDNVTISTTPLIGKVPSPPTSVAIN